MAVDSEYSLCSRLHWIPFSHVLKPFSHSNCNSNIGQSILPTLDTEGALCWVQRICGYEISHENSQTWEGEGESGEREGLSHIWLTHSLSFCPKTLRDFHRHRMQHTHPFLGEVPGISPCSVLGPGLSGYFRVVCCPIYGYKNAATTL